MALGQRPKDPPSALARRISHAIGHGQPAGRTDNIGIAYTVQPATTMHTQAPVRTGPTLPPIASLLDGLMAKTPAPETLGARIARLRRDKGLTQAELAARLQVSQPVVSDYENDVIRVPADVVVQIAQILDASTDELLGIKAAARPSGANGQIENRRLYRRMQQIEQLPRRDQDALLRTIEAFISKTG